MHDPTIGRFKCSQFRDKKNLQQNVKSHSMTCVTQIPSLNCRTPACYLQMKQWGSLWYHCFVQCKQRHRREGSLMQQYCRSLCILIIKSSSFPSACYHFLIRIPRLLATNGYWLMFSKNVRSGLMLSNSWSWVVNLGVLWQMNQFGLYKNIQIADYQDLFSMIVYQ